MKHISVSMLFILPWVLETNTVALDGNRTNIKISIIPEVLRSTELVSPCDFRCFSNASSCSECSTVTLNELINVSKGIFTANDAYFYEIVFSSGTHVVNTSQNLLLFTTTAYMLRMNLTGEGNVTIFCVSEFHLRFLDIHYINISNLQLKYCNGHTSKTHDERQTLTLYTNKIYSMIILDKVIMINQNNTGIRIKFKVKRQDVQSCTYIVRLTNSNIIAGNVEVQILTSPLVVNSNTYKIRMDNVSFLHSCFKVGHKAQTKHFEINIANTNFIYGSCSPVLSFSGHTTVELTNLNVTNTSSTILLHSLEKNTIFLRGHCRFNSNRGAVLIASKSKLVFIAAKVEFIKNKVYGSKIENPGTVIAADDSTIVFNSSHVRFEKNYGQNCGGIATTNEAIISFNNSKIDFIGNNGTRGGAMSLFSRSILMNGGTAFNSTLTFIQNRAEKGGAIFIDDRSYVYDHKLHTSVIQSGYKVHFKFSENKAYKGGHNIYGGWVDWAISMEGHSVTYDSKIGNVLLFEGNDSEITSDPTRLCICTNQVPDCNITYSEIVYPGQKFSVDLVGVGQRYGTVEAHVKASLIGSESKLQTTGIQTITKACTTLDYVILSPNKQETLLMTTWSNDGPIFESAVLERYPDKLGLLFNQSTIGVQLKECPLGFLLDKIEHRCTCYSSLSVLGLSCDSLAYKIYRSEQQWIGVVHEHMIADESPGVIAHQHCPFDYCRTNQESFLISLEHQDEQCAFNHSGILCGGCQTNFSRVMGSSKCKKCSNLTLLILPGVLLAGLLLVTLLMVLNLTVSVGTINGLVFYANVIQIQHATIFASESRSSTSFLSMFIAWLNLDLGIECCLYNGFNAYTETWLQFCFPLYIWLLAATIIVSSHYSTRVSKLISVKNAVQVLATLFLLSYTKLLRLFVDVVSYTIVTYPDGYTKSVWLYDGNIDFLGGKHIPLFIASILLLLVFIVPYLLFLLGVQWLHKVPVPHYHVRRWVHGLKPLSNAYSEPYKANHRYWSGLHLLARIVLLIIFSANRSNGPNISLLATILLSSILQMWLYFTKWVYKCQLINCLEVLFLCNLGITSIFVLLELSYSTHNKTSTVVYISTGIAFIKFISILIYHIQRAFFLTGVGVKLKRKLLKGNMKLEIEEMPDEQQTGFSKVTTTVVDLTHPLMKR